MELRCQAIRRMQFNSNDVTNDDFRIFSFQFDANN